MRTFIKACTFVLLVGCQQLDDGSGSLYAKSIGSDVYPVDPGVHMGIVILVDNTGQVTPLLSNAAAYARYAIELSLTSPASSESEEMAMVTDIANGGIPIETAKVYHTGIRGRVRTC